LDFFPVLIHPPSCTISLRLHVRLQSTCSAAISHIGLEKIGIRSASALQKICSSYIWCSFVEGLGFKIGKKGLPTKVSKGSPDTKRPDMWVEKYLLNSLPKAFLRIFRHPTPQSPRKRSIICRVAGVLGSFFEEAIQDLDIPTVATHYPLLNGSRNYKEEFKLVQSKTAEYKCMFNHFAYMTPWRV
jgi:hypothetical protein